MADVLTEKQRSYCMSRVRSKNTKPEIKLRKALWKAGLRYRLKSALPGKPDIVFPRASVVIFVDGCFWHNCPIHGSKPATNIKFWESKISSNVARDAKVNEELKNMGWIVLRCWEHEVKEDLDFLVRLVTKSVKNKRDAEKGANS